MIVGGVASTLAEGALITADVAVAIGAVAVGGVKALYENVKPVRNFVDDLGDSINDIGKSFTKAFS